MFPNFQKICINNLSFSNKKLLVITLFQRVRMFLPVNFVKMHISDHICTALGASAEDAGLDKIKIYNLLTTPPDFNLGQYCFPCFPLAKALRKGPPQIAGELAGKIQKTNLIENIVATGPYVNFTLNFGELAKELLPAINTKKFFELKLTQDEPKSIIEYSQPNTHKEIHVGHMRNLCLGDAIVRLYKYCGIETIGTTFPGDVGTHVAKCLWYWENYNKEEPPKTRKGAWLGTLYTKGNNLLEEQKGTEKEAENRAQLTDILKQLHAGKGKYYDIWKQTRAWSIELMEEVYKWAGVKFDYWYWESDVDAASVHLVGEYLDKGVFTLDDGAVGIDLKEDKLGFCLLLKSDGTGLYATKDLELARRKFEDHKVDRSIYVVDNRQSLHFKQVFKTLEKMGFEQAQNCYHLQYEMVELPDGAMSSRKGNIVPIQDLIDNMVNKIKVDYLDRYDDWSDSEKLSVANMVARGAIKFGMTRVDNNKKIVFDMADWLKLDGESGPYIQYVHARIQSMVKKIGSVDASKVDYSVLEHTTEKQILTKLMDFNCTVQESCKNFKTLSLCAYLYDLSKLFNSFYAECSVAQAETETLKVARISLCQAVATTLEAGLALLGIEAPDRM